MQRIDLHAILRSRIKGWKRWLIPGFLISGLEKIVHQKELNAVLEATEPSTGSEFSRRTYDFFDLTLEVKGLENIPASGRFIFAGNHPLGGLDGIGIIKVLGEKYGDDNIHFLVNDMLMNVEPLRPVFLPINKYGSQSREAAAKIEAAYAGQGEMIVFPAGLVSRLHDDGTIADLKWHKSFITKAIEHQRDIIPMHFEGLNRRRFYRLARWRKRLGIAFNIEQLFLPAEVCATRGKTFRLTFGKPISWKELRDSGKSHADLAAKIRQFAHSPEFYFGD